MKKILRQYFPSLLTVVVVAPVSILLMKFNGASVWTNVATALILLGSLVTVGSFIYSIIKYLVDKE